MFYIRILIALVALSITGSLEAHGHFRSSHNLKEGKFYQGLGWYNEGYFYPYKDKQIRPLWYYQAGAIHKHPRAYRYPHLYKNPKFSGLTHRRYNAHGYRLDHNRALYYGRRFPHDQKTEH